jgi:hypothetical protein
MKTIVNQKVAYEAEAFNPFTGQRVTNDKDEPVTKIIESDYGKLIMDCVKIPNNPSTGFTYDEIENIDTVKKAIKESVESREIKVEDAIFKFILEKVEKKSWGIPCIEFVQFKKDLKTLA